MYKKVGPNAWLMKKQIDGLVVKFCGLFSGELAEAIRRKPKMKFGLYHSLFEWFNPLYLRDEAANFSTQDFVKVYITLHWIYLSS